MEAMFDPPGDEELPDVQRPSNAMEWYRTLLWAMPACVAVSTLIAVTALFARFSVPLGRWVIPAWLGLNVVSTIALGVFQARLKVCDGKGVARKLDVVVFVVLQVVIVPFVCHLVFMVLVMAGL